MALLTSSRISRLAVEMLSRSLVLPNTVARIPGDDYSGPAGTTVTLRVPQPRVSRVQAAPSATITYDALEETGVDVTLAHLYDATRVSDEELSLELEDFGRQVLRPQIMSVAEGAEDVLAAVMNSLAAELTFAAVASDDDTVATILAARQALSAANVPAGDRYFAVAPDIATRLLSVERLTDVASRGDRSALADASIGRLYGFTFVESPSLTAGTAVAYHSSAFAFGNRAPAPPSGGVGSSATATVGGVALRHIVQYVPDRLSDASVVSTFVGAAVVPDSDVITTSSRVVKIGTAA